MSHNEQRPKSKSDSVRQNPNRQENRPSSSRNSGPFSNTNHSSSAQSNPMPTNPVHLGGGASAMQTGGATNPSVYSQQSAPVNEGGGNAHNIASMVNNRMVGSTGSYVSTKEAQYDSPSSQNRGSYSNGAQTTPNQQNYSQPANSQTYNQQTPNSQGSSSGTFSHQQPQTVYAQPANVPQTPVVDNSVARNQFLRTGVASEGYNPSTDRYLKDLGNNRYIALNDYNNLKDTPQALESASTKDITSQYMSERKAFLETGYVAKEGCYRPETDASLRNVGNNTYVTVQQHDEYLLKTYESRVQDGTLDLSRSSLKDVQQEANNWFQKTGVFATYEKGDAPIPEAQRQYVDIRAPKVKDEPRTPSNSGENTFRYIDTKQQYNELLKNKDSASEYLQNRNTFMQTGQVTGNYAPSADSSLRNVGKDTFVDNDHYKREFEARIRQREKEIAKEFNEALYNEKNKQIAEMNAQISEQSVRDILQHNNELREKIRANYPSNQDIEAKLNKDFQECKVKGGIKASYKDGVAPVVSDGQINAKMVQIRNGLDSKGNSTKGNGTPTATGTSASATGNARTVSHKTKEGPKTREGYTGSISADKEIKKVPKEQIKDLGKKADGKKSGNEKTVTKKGGNKVGNFIDNKITANRQKAMNVDLVKIAEGKKAQKTLMQNVGKTATVVGVTGGVVKKLADENTDTAEAMMSTIADGISNKFAHEYQKGVTRKQEVGGAKKKVKQAAKQKEKAIVKEKTKGDYKKKNQDIKDARNEYKNRRKNAKDKSELDDIKKEYKNKKKNSKDEYKKKKKDVKKDARKSIKKEKKKALKATKRFGKGPKITSFSDLLKKLLKAVSSKVAVPLLLGFLLLVVIGVFPMIIAMGGGSIFAVIASRFASTAVSIVDGSWTPIGQLYTALEDMNYAQYIEEQTVVVMGGSFEESAKRDAQAHYSSFSSKKQLMTEVGGVQVPMYDWYCDIGEGQIGNVWMREECDYVTLKDGTIRNLDNSFSSSDLLYHASGHLAHNSDIVYTYNSNPNDRMNITINANMVPILSMAHERFPGEWTYENVLSIQSYVYYMYALSHNTAHYDPTASGSDANTYSFTYGDTHDDGTLWDAEFDWDSAWNSETSTLTRPNYHLTSGHYDHSDCTNIYIHGYDKNLFFGDGAKACVDKAAEAGRKFLSWLDGFTGTDLASYVKQAGVIHLTYVRGEDGRPDYGHNGTIYANNYNSSNIYNEFDRNGDGQITYQDGICYNKKEYKYSNTPVCGKESHTHTNECYTRECFNTNQYCHHWHSCVDCCTLYATYGAAGHPGQDHVWGCEHADPNHTNCTDWRADHTHTGGEHPAADNQMIGEDVISGLGCRYVLGDCEEHTHSEWHSAADPGCYDTALVCKGHCGGHINPTINLAVTYTFEGLAYQDAVAFKNGEADSNFVAAIDLNASKFPAKKTVAKWSRNAVKNCRNLFDYLPNGPVSALVWAGQNVVGFGLDLHGWWHGLWHDSGDEGAFDITSGSNTRDTNERGGSASLSSDSEGFQGWFDASNSTQLNRSLMRELYSFYGTPEDMYAKGVDLWREFDVTFHIGYGPTLDPATINNIVNAIKDAGYNLGNGRESVIRDALRHSGMYTYVCDSNAHYNGMYADAGPSECTGFVSGVYMRALGSKCGFWNDVSSSFVSTGGEHGAGSGRGSGGISRFGPSGSYGWQRYQYAEYKYSSNRPTGNSTSTRDPGDVICISNGNASGQGHAMIYLGQFTDPITGVYDHYVVDCSSSMGGSAYRVFSRANEYPYVYSPFEKTPVQ